MEGSKVTFQFILYHCEQAGKATTWKEVDKWKKTIEDKRDEPVGDLHDLTPGGPDTVEMLTPQLTELFLRFIEKVS